MKKLLISVLEYANIKFDKAAIEASTDIELSEENLQKIQSELEEAKGFKEKHETAAADVTRLTAELATANGTIGTLTSAKEKAEGELVNATAALETANARVTELEAAAGIDPSNPGRNNDEPNAGVPSWVDPNAEHYKNLREQGINLGF